MLYAIGDIHGELTMLKMLFNEIEPELGREDTLIFVGDYVDRGENSRGVVDFVVELKDMYEVVALRGNHEQMMLDSYSFFTSPPGRSPVSEDAAMIWFQNGAYQTLASYPPNGGKPWYTRIPDEHWLFFQETLMEFETKHFHFVHAGVVPTGVSWTDAEWDPRLWIRDPFIDSEEDFGKVVVFGHTPRDRPLVEENKIGIDTGAVFGGALTAVVLDDELPLSKQQPRFIQVR